MDAAKTRNGAMLMGDRFYLVMYWIAVVSATAWMVTDDTDLALWSLGWAILFRLFWQESRPLVARLERDG